MTRKANNGKELTNPQKVMNYLNSLPKGSIIKTKDILENTGLSRPQFKNTTKNETIKQFLEANKTSKKGEYLIP